MDSALKASKKTYKTPLIEMINARCVGTIEFIDGNSLQLFFILKNHDDELPEMQREMFHHLIQAWVNGDEMKYYNVSMQEWLADKSINESLDRALNVLARMYVHNVRPEFYSELKRQSKRDARPGKKYSNVWTPYNRQSRQQHHTTSHHFFIFPGWKNPNTISNEYKKHNCFQEQGPREIRLCAF